MMDPASLRKAGDAGLNCELCNMPIGAALFLLVTGHMVLNSTMDQTDTGLLKAPRSKCRHFRQARPHGALLGSLIISRRWGTGGTDKPDNPHEKRIVGDQGCPHPEQALRERGLMGRWTGRSSSA